MKNILVVDDNEMVLTMLSDWLGGCSEEWKIITADNGTKAIEILGSLRVDFVITDLEMPVTDGYEVLAHAKEYHPFLPVIPMTGAYGPEAAVRLRRLEVGKPLKKPFDLRRLAATIAERLDGAAFTG